MTGRLIVTRGYCNAHKTLYEFRGNDLTRGLTLRNDPLKNGKVLKETVEIHRKATRKIDVSAILTGSLGEPSCCVLGAMISCFVEG